MRKIALLGLILIVVVVAAWSAVWLYAADEAGRRIDAWLKSEEAQGRTWACPNRAIGGYPTALTIACTNPTYTGRMPGETDRGQATSLLAEVSLAHPQQAVVTLSAPLTYKSSNGQADVRASWSNVTIDLEELTDVHTIALHGTDLVVSGNFGGPSTQTWKPKSLDLTLDLTPKDVIGFKIAAKGTNMKAVDDMVGGQAPIDVDLTGRLSRADVSSAATPVEAMDRWRQSGGRVALGPSRVSRDGASVSASGDLGLDDAHRLQGRLDASFVGLEPVLKRYGISGDIAAAGSLLSSLFGGGRPAPQTPAAPGALNFVIRFNNGRLGIGPISTSVALSPLY